MAGIYRNTTLGIALTNTLDNMVSSNLISARLGQYVVSEFDKVSMLQSLF